MPDAPPGLYARKSPFMISNTTWFVALGFVRVVTPAPRDPLVRMLPAPALSEDTDVAPNEAAPVLLIVPDPAFKDETVVEPNDAVPVFVIDPAPASSDDTNKVALGNIYFDPSYVK